MNFISTAGDILLHISPKPCILSFSFIHCILIWLTCFSNLLPILPLTKIFWRDKLHAAKMVLKLPSQFINQYSFDNGCSITYESKWLTYHCALVPQFGLESHHKRLLWSFYLYSSPINYELNNNNRRQKETN